MSVSVVEGLPFKLNTIFTEIYEEEQACLKKINEESSTAKTCYYCAWAFGIIGAPVTIAIARTKPFNLMRGVQSATFFTIVGAIVSYCVKQFLELRRKFPGDIKRNYGNFKIYKNLPIEPKKERLVALFNYYQNKSREYSSKCTQQPPFDSTAMPDWELNKICAQALVCKVQAAYIQCVINDFNRFSDKIYQDPESLKKIVFTCIDTLFLNRSDANYRTQNIVAFTSGGALTLTAVEEMTIEEISDRIQEKMQEAIEKEEARESKEAG